MNCLLSCEHMFNLRNRLLFRGTEDACFSRKACWAGTSTAEKSTGGLGTQDASSDCLKVHEERVLCVGPDPRRCLLAVPQLDGRPCPFRVHAHVPILGFALHEAAVVLPDVRVPVVECSARRPGAELAVLVLAADAMPHARVCGQG